MKQIFEYSKVETALDSISVPDIGNCTLKINKGVSDYYLIIKTELGDTTFCEFGPIDNEKNDKKNYKFSYKLWKLPYNEKGIGKTIRTFLKTTNDPLAILMNVSVEIIEYEDAINILKDIDISDI